MTETLAFDDGVAKRFDWFYASGDIMRRRKAVLDALGASPGERVIDVGCGPGFYVAEIADAVGEAGRVTGVDRSRHMIDAADRRLGDRRHVTLIEGEATSLPVEDSSHDAAISVQVFEYVVDIGTALSEMYRVLLPRGRLVLWDVDWSTVSWHSADPGRMGRVLAAWDDHGADPVLPRTLARSMERAGFVDVAVEGHAFVNTDAGSDAYSAGIIDFVRDFVPGHRGVTDSEAEAWKVELLDLSKSGDYFFACTQFCFSAIRP